MEEETVSILIRTKNEERYIGKTLSAIFSQTYKNCEVLIVDSGSTDLTLKIARKYAVRIYEIKPEDFTFGYSLNYGFQRARGKYVVCLSAHALPLSKDWIKTVIANFSDDNVAAVMTKTLPWPDCNPFDRRGLIKKFNIKKQEIKEGPPFIFGNYGSAISRDVWHKIPFDESLSYSEDYDWIKKVRQLNYRIIYEPDAKVYHSHNETIKQIYRRYYQEACAKKKLKIRNYTFFNVFFDAVVGSIYDMLYVLLKRDNLKWFFIAPLRRFTMNFARYRASRR